VKLVHLVGFITKRSLSVSLIVVIIPKQNILAYVTSQMAH